MNSKLLVLVTLLSFSLTVSAATDMQLRALKSRCINQTQSYKQESNCFRRGIERLINRGVSDGYRDSGRRRGTGRRGGSNIRVRCETNNSYTNTVYYSEVFYGFPGLGRNNRSYMNQAVTECKNRTADSIEQHCDENVDCYEI